MTTFARRAVEGGYWVLAIVLVGAYCALQSYGERERHALIAPFLQRAAASEVAIVESADPHSPDATAGP